MTATDVPLRPSRTANTELADRIVSAPMPCSFAVEDIPGAAYTARP